MTAAEARRIGRYILAFVLGPPVAALILLMGAYAVTVVFDMLGLIIGLLDGWIWFVIVLWAIAGLICMGALHDHDDTKERDGGN